jgi:hypothetical protein
LIVGSVPPWTIINPFPFVPILISLYHNDSKCSDDISPAISDPRLVNSSSDYYTLHSLNIFEWKLKIVDDFSEWTIDPPLSNILILALFVPSFDVPHLFHIQFSNKNDVWFNESILRDISSFLSPYSLINSEIRFFVINLVSALLLITLTNNPPLISIWY